MSNFAILRIEKLKTLGNAAGSGAHVMRTLKNDQGNIDKERTYLNKTFIGTGNTLVDIQSALPDKYRKNAVLAVEVLMTATPAFFQGKTQNEIEAWAKESVRSAVKFWNNENIVSAVLHMDEKTPHLHLHVVPKIEGKLNCREFIGTRSKLSKLQTAYANDMQKFGLRRGIEGSKAKHQTPSQVAKDAAKQPKLKARNLEIVDSKESIFMGVGEKIKTKTIKVPTTKSAKAAEKEAAKVPLLEKRVKSLTQTLDEYKPRAEVSLMRDMDLADVCFKFGYTQSKNDKSKWKTPIGTISITKQKFFDHGTGVGGGGAIDFLMYCESVDFKQAIEMLSGEMGTNYTMSAVSKKACKDVLEQIKNPRKIHKPEPSPGFTENLVGWLVKKRKIPSELANEWVQKGKVYASRFGNSWQAVFVHSDSAFNRVNPQTGFKGWAKGSKIDEPMFVKDIDPLKKTAIVEGHLDGLALQSLRPDLNVCIAGGVSNAGKFARKLKLDGHDVIFALDNDKAGQSVANQYRHIPCIVPQSKDWNDDLMNLSTDCDSNSLTDDLNRPHDSPSL